MCLVFDVTDLLRVSVTWRQQSEMSGWARSFSARSARERTLRRVRDGIAVARGSRVPLRAPRRRPRRAPRSAATRRADEPSTGQMASISRASRSSRRGAPASAAHRMRFQASCSLHTRSPACARSDSELATARAKPSDQRPKRLHGESAAARLGAKMRARCAPLLRPIAALERRGMKQRSAASPESLRSVRSRPFRAPRPQSPSPARPSKRVGRSTTSRLSRRPLRAAQQQWRARRVVSSQQRPIHRPHLM